MIRFKSLATLVSGCFLPTKLTDKMKLTDALKVVDLIRDRERLIDMRARCIEKPNCGWSLAINDVKVPIPTEVKSIFSEAIEKALAYYNSEIAKL